MEQEPFLTAKQLAERWNMTTGALQMQRQRKTGIPYTRFGRSIRYRLSEVLAAEQEGYVTPKKEKASQ